ncbi:MAG TPA: acyltransferase [Alphaproteobacteria bacterium]|nr:acyltransferase [Alphaproteobacteria bacterium]
MSAKYIPALDGFRAIAIAMVVLSHAGLQLMPGGLGVLIFFVISGFLLTRQMIEEIESSGGFDIKQFYLRRLFRLMPTLFLYIAVMCAALIPLGANITLQHIASGLFYYANYYQLFIGYPPHNPMPILWSLAVEEHYYILFPLVMLAFRKKLPTLMPWLFGIMIVVLLWRSYLALTCGRLDLAVCGLPNENRLFGTDTICDCILFGAITALMMRYAQNKVQRAINPYAFFVATIVLLITLCVRDETFRTTARFTVQSICVAIIVLNVLYGNWIWPRDIISTKPFLFVGHISYSLYLFHYGVLVVMNTLHHTNGDVLHGPRDIIIYLAASFGLATISHYLIEKPAINWRKRFGARAAY